MVEKAPHAPGPDRRTILTATAAALLAAALPWPVRAGRAAPRIAAIDWAMLETAVALGHSPVAAAELIQFRRIGATTLPPATIDLGLRGSPNLEVLHLARPDLILSSSYYTSYEPQLARIAPVLSLTLFAPGIPPMRPLTEALDSLALRLDDPAAAARARHQTDARLNAAAARLSAHAGRPLALIDIGDQRHFRIFGADSLFGATLGRLGLANAWHGDTAYSFLAPVPIERLAEIPEATLILTGPVPPHAAEALAESLLWRSLPQVALGRIHQLPRMNAFGGLPSALHFADCLVTAMA
ncbi:ABC transporter substrate-binding protein [Paracoccus sp. NSM]|uniref:ABC transporter substrate-binding protein n=1 Tax=Paracoccus sp. NSM TaxID=3457784 RepID=UPI004034FC4E